MTSETEKLFSQAASALNNGQWLEARSLFSALTTAPSLHAQAIRSLTAIDAVMQGDQLLADEHPEAAIRSYQQAIAAMPDFFRPYNHLGNACMHQGDYEHAEQYFLQAARLNSRYAPTFCNLGSIAAALGNLEAAIAYLNKAVSLNPSFGYAYEVLGEAHAAAGHFQEAALAVRHASECDPENPHLLCRLGALERASGNAEGAIRVYLQALALAPDLHEAHEELGDLFKADGRWHDALDHYRFSLQLRPDSSHAWLAMGETEVQLQHHAAALDCFRRVMTLEPGFAVGHAKAANVLSLLGDHQAAIRHMEDALRLDPQNVDFHGALSTIFSVAGQPEAALASCEKGLKLDPAHPGLLTNKAQLLIERKKIDLALDAINRALQIDPHIPEAHLNKATILFHQDRLDEARATCLKALEYNPGFAEAYSALAAIDGELGDFEAMITHGKQALALNPALAVACNNLGKAYMELGNFQEASSFFERAYELSPDDPLVFSNLLFSLLNCKDASVARYLEIARSGGQRITARLEKMPEAKEIRQRSESRHHRGPLLRIGMVSGDFRAHPVGFFLESILELTDKQTIHLTAYSTQQNREDDLTGKLQSLFQQWRDVAQLDDSELARKIQSDDIDILIDLAGHTAFNRCTVFAWKPAPVQVSWLGYFASTGIPGMDYFLTDPVSSPPGSEQQFTETLWYLPDTRLCFSPPALTQPIPVSPPPCLRNGFITFGCFQRPSKINDEVIRLWSQILQALPGSRMRLKCPSLNTEKTREAFLDHLAAKGLTRSLIDIEGKSSREDYLRSYGNVDIMLDTFPFPGGTTSCEALWMGVPTVTLNGETLIQRQGASLLTAAGMSDWIAETPDEYVTKAIRFARDPALLAQIRATQRLAIEASPVMDAPRFVRHLEKALLGMWDEHAAKHPS